jgi:hypothetical protein
VGETEFEFDAEVINTTAYRRAFASAQRRRATKENVPDETVPGDVPLPANVPQETARSDSRPRGKVELNRKGRLVFREFDPAPSESEASDPESELSDNSEERSKHRRGRDRNDVRQKFKGPLVFRGKKKTRCRTYTLGQTIGGSGRFGKVKLASR